ncbi:hypothetical protein C2S52_023200 [Perilla frutescens var. hirtella]|nr:hypothetical protein C2S52_023200 [Perilla frutescens var. hirtella]KAH6816861.1 hypothetical protein C2S51_000464 [Perilla frutescens var. frutescens]
MKQPSSIGEDFDTPEEQNAIIVDEIKFLMKNSTDSRNNLAIATNLTFGGSKIAASASHHRCYVLKTFLQYRYQIEGIIIPTNMGSFIPSPMAL